jgi:hypothetical protein
LPLGFGPPVAPLDVSPGLPRLPHLPALPAMDLRVAPNLASFSASGYKSPGCPESSPFQLRLPMIPRVAPVPASSGFAGDRLASCLAARPSALPGGVKLRVAPQLGSSDSASWCSCGLPRTPTPLRLCLGFESPSLPESSLPWRRLTRSAGCPESRPLRLCRFRVLGSPRILRLRLGR